MTKHFIPKLTHVLLMASASLLFQVGCGGAPENLAVEPPEDFKLVPIEDSSAYNAATSNDMNPDK
ncbi:hypothetical protein [Neorhodopirellula lusitana]|uniref:hypothetical protein n=1 Tax=Neorhodopirellula lusitana TaxID=445327 RepID=UPI003850F827